MKKKKKTKFKYTADSFTLTGDCTEFYDLFEREEKRSRTNFEGKPSDYRYVAMVSADKRVTSVLLFHAKAFEGAGVAIRCPEDKYIEVAGLRLAMSRALQSVGEK